MNGVRIEFTNTKGDKETDHAQRIDFRNPAKNDFLVVNQFTVAGTKKPRRPDIMAFVNGLPMGLIELKNPADTNADIWKAYNQLQTYKDEIADLLVFNEALNHILGLEDGKKRFLDVMASVTKAYSLCGTLDEAAELRTEIAFFSAIRAALVKHGNVGKKLSEDEKNSALKQILDNAIRAEGVNDIFTLAGLDKPNIGLLSDEFLEDVRKTPLKNLAVELLERLLKDEIRSNSRTNVVQERKYSERLLATLAKYHNRAIETAQVIEELIAMAKDFSEALKRNEELGLNQDEIAFYDALAERPKVLTQMGDETLKKLAIELTEKLRASTTVDWQVRDSVRASMRLMIKRLLRKYKYPPEGQEAAVATVLKQAEALADSWSN